jgi:hypothetical protein
MVASLDLLQAFLPFEIAFPCLPFVITYPYPCPYLLPFPYFLPFPSSLEEPSTYCYSIY